MTILKTWHNYVIEKIKSNFDLYNVLYTYTRGLIICHYELEVTRWEDLYDVQKTISKCCGFSRYLFTVWSLGKNDMEPICNLERTNSDE